MNIKQIDYKTAIDFVLPKHYSGRKFPVSKAFGWYDKNNLCAVCSFGKPASPSLCVGICGQEFSQNVYELNRLCRVDNLKNQLSQFVAGCLRILKPMNWIIVSYADTDMNHSGYIYQACNFIYTGKTKSRTDKYTPGNKHSRHYDNDKQFGLRKIRSSKHRYIFFCSSDKKLKEKWRKSLNYEITLYPKEENKHYILGSFQEPKII